MQKRKLETVGHSDPVTMYGWRATDGTPLDKDTARLYTIISVIWLVLCLVGFILGLIAFQYSPSLVFGADGGRVIHLLLGIVVAPVEIITGSMEIHQQNHRCNQDLA